MSQVHAKVRPRHTISDRKAWYFLISTVGVIALAGFLANVFTAPWNGFMPTGKAQSFQGEELHTATIARQVDDEKCVLAKFDNRSGRIIDDEKHCERTIVLDAHGVVVPIGTVHRLESISKSFGNQH